MPLAGSTGPGGGVTLFSGTLDTSTRVEWMDALRGTAILLLILWHASAIPQIVGFQMPAWLFVVNEAFLPWRMPTLMFLSGMLLHRSLRKPPSIYVTSKVRLLLWPCLVWTAVYLVLHPAEGESITSPVSWFGAGYLWYILYLFLYYMGAPVLVRLPWWILLPLLWAVGAVVDHPALHKFAFFALFFFAGYQLRGLAVWAATCSRGWLALGLGATAAFTMLSLALAWPERTHYFQFSSMTVPAVLVMLLVSVRLLATWMASFRGGTVARTLTWIGRNSIVFYLTHFPVMTGLALVAAAFGVPVGSWIVPAGVVLAGGVGVVLSLVRHRVPVAWLFEAPRLGRSRSLRQPVSATT